MSSPVSEGKTESSREESEQSKSATEFRLIISKCNRFRESLPICYLQVEHQRSCETEKENKEHAGRGPFMLGVLMTKNTKCLI